GKGGPGNNVSVPLLGSPEPRVVEVRGAERAAEVLSGMAAPGVDRASAPRLGTQQVKEIAMVRFGVVGRDVVGHPTAPGSTWTVADTDPTVKRKSMTVDRLEPLGAARGARGTGQKDRQPQR